MRITAPRVFISYSHESPEHADRVLELSARLRREGIETLLDRYEAAPEEGWPRWMARHVRDADFVLLICTETYYRRVMGDEKEGQGLGVRWEGHLIFQHLYDAGTVNRKFIPLVFQGSDRRFIPEPLRGYSFYDLSTEAGYLAMYRRLTGQPDVDVPTVGTLRELPVPERRWEDRPPPPLIRVPRLPSHYLERSKLAFLKEKLLTDHVARMGVSGSGQQLGVQGMAGIGKTVLVAALCHEPDVAERFPDGIIWLTLGQTPNVERRQIDLFGCFSDQPPQFGDAESGRIALSRLLSDKRCLIVLDDVWSLADARAFDVIGPGGALLITTRDAGIVRRLDIELVPLEVFDEEQSLKLLAKTSGRTVEDLTPAALDVVRECGYLPLAIAMIGGMVHGIEDPWPTALARLRQYRLDRIQQEFPDYPYPNLLRAVQVGTDYLTPEHRRCYGDLAVFPEDVHIPGATLQTLWSSSDWDELDIAEMVRDFVEKSLMFRDEHGRCFLHDIQRAYLLRKAENISELHNRLLGKYAARSPAGWVSGPDDGYFFQHLIHHFGAAGRSGEALDVLTDYRWLTRQLYNDGLPAVINDCDTLASAPGVDEETRRAALTLRDACRLSGHLLEQRPGVLAEQLHGRLRGEPNPAIRRLLEQSATAKTGVWLRPTFASLDRPGGRLQRTIPQPAAPTAVLCLPDGRIVSAVGKALLLYDPASGVSLGELGRHVEKVIHAAISADGTLIASASEDGILNLFHSEDNELAATLPVPQAQQITRLACIPDSRLFVGGASPHLWLIDPENGSFTSLPVGHEKKITALAVSPCGNRIVSGSEDGTIRIWNRQTSSLERVIEMESRWAYVARIGAVIVTPDGKSLISASSWRGPLKMWDLESGEEIKTFGKYDDFSVSMVITNDGLLIEGGHWNYFEAIDGFEVFRFPYIRLWDPSSGSLREEIGGHYGPITALALAQDGRSFVSASSDQTVRLWHLEPGSAAAPEAESTLDGEVAWVRVHPSGRWVLAANKGWAESIDSVSGRRLTAYESPEREGEIEGIGISADGEWALLAIGRGGSEDRTTTLEAFEFESGRRVRVLQPTREADSEVAFFQNLQVTADGRYAAIVGMCYADLEEGGFANQGVVVWSLESEKIVKVLYVPTPNHGKPYIDDWPTAMSRDSRYFTFTTIEEKFRLCDLQNDFAITTYGEHKGWIGGVAFLTRSGLAVTAGGNDEAIRAWAVSDGAQVWEWEKQGRIKAIAVSPSERYILFGTDSNELHVSSVADGKAIVSFRLDAPITALDVHVESALIAVGDETGRIHTFTVENCPDW